MHAKRAFTPPPVFYLINGVVVNVVFTQLTLPIKGFQRRDDALGVPPDLSDNYAIRSMHAAVRLIDPFNFTA